MIQVDCLFCKKVFFVHPYRKDSVKFCSRSCLGKSRIGNKNPCWRGGRSKRIDGYIMINSKNIFEHRLIMENYLGRKLGLEEKIHHVNGIRDDNRIENLKLVENQSIHAKLHDCNRYKDIYGRYL